MTRPGATTIRLDEVACNLCGSSRSRTRFEKTGHLTGHRFRIVECERCGLVFVNPRLSSECVRDLYDAAYFRGEGFDPYADYDMDTAGPIDRAALARRAVERVMAVLPPPSRLIEVGPGQGLLLREATARGYTVSGIELSSHAVERLRKDGLHVIHGTLEEADIPDGSVDVVVAVEVLEHLLDPKRFLREASRVLRPGGLLYYETGDIDCESARRLGPEWDYVRPEGHLYYFSPRSLRRYLRESGFEACYPRWFNPSRRLIDILAYVGMVDVTVPVFRGIRGAVARLICQISDLLPSRCPYPLARRIS